MSNQQNNGAALEEEPANGLDRQSGSDLGDVAPNLSSSSDQAIELPVERLIKTTTTMVEEAYAAKVAANVVSRDQLDLITSFLIVGRNQGMNMSALAREIAVNPSTLHRLFSAEYGAKIDSLLERIEQYLKLWKERTVMGSGEFISTSIVSTCFEACDLARAHAIPVLLYGESQTGKTTAFQEYQRRNNHGSTIYVRMPTGGAKGKFTRELVKALGEKVKRNSWELEEIPKELLNPQKLLIIDELHQCLLPSSNAGVRIQTIEYIREIYDKTGCGMLLCGTHIAREAMERGKHMDQLEQLRRRGIPPIQLPALLPDEDMDKIAASYGLPPAPTQMLYSGRGEAIKLNVIEWRKKLVLSTGLKAYVTFLRMSGTMASKRKTEPTWAHVVSAHDILAKLSVGKEGK